MKVVSSELNEMATKTSPKGKISYEEFLNWCDEDTRAEWVDGEVSMVSPASKRHQNVSLFLSYLLHSYVVSKNLGEILQSPFQMKLGLSGREPDILFVASAHLDRLKDTYLDGPADTVIEIISRESRNRDWEDKFIEYESAEIPEYWIIDPVTEQAEFFRLGADNHYYSVAPDVEGCYYSEAIPDFWVKISWLWEDPLPSVLLILREMDII